MPKYQYECQRQECKFSQEIVQSIMDNSLDKCPKCGYNTLIRIIQRPGIIFKGWFPGEEIRNINRINNETLE